MGSFPETYNNPKLLPLRLFTAWMLKNLQHLLFIRICDNQGTLSKLVCCAIVLMVNEKKNCIIKILQSNFQYQNAKELMVTYRRWLLTRIKS